MPVKRTDFPFLGFGVGLRRPLHPSYRPASTHGLVRGDLGKLHGGGRPSATGLGEGSWALPRRPARGLLIDRVNRPPEPRVFEATFLTCSALQALLELGPSLLDRGRRPQFARPS